MTFCILFEVQGEPGDTELSVHERLKHDAYTHFGRPIHQIATTECGNAKARALFGLIAMDSEDQEGQAQERLAGLQRERTTEGPGLDHKLVEDTLRHYSNRLATLEEDRTDVGNILLEIQARLEAERKERMARSQVHVTRRQQVEDLAAELAKSQRTGRDFAKQVEERLNILESGNVAQVLAEGARLRSSPSGNEPSLDERIMDVGQVAGGAAIDVAELQEAYKETNRRINVAERAVHNNLQAFDALIDRVTLLENGSGGLLGGVQELEEHLERMAVGVGKQGQRLRELEKIIGGVTTKEIMDAITDIKVHVMDALAAAETGLVAHEERLAVAESQIKQLDGAAVLEMNGFKGRLLEVLDKQGDTLNHHQNTLVALDGRIDQLFGQVGRMRNQDIGGWHPGIEPGDVT